VFSQLGGYDPAASMSRITCDANAHKPSFLNGSKTIRFESEWSLQAEETG
jgi:hypothetical protein